MGGTKHYTYHVTAYNQLGGESEASYSFDVTPISVPSGMLAPTRVTHTQTSITMQWAEPSISDGSSEVIRYDLEIKADYEASFTRVFAGVALQATAEDLLPGFTYAFRVRAVNERGPSAMSPTSVAILTALVPGVPQGLTLVERSSTEVTVRWALPEDRGGV